jgi:hypothetical protein
MNRYANHVAPLSRTRGNDLCDYLALAIAAAALPGAALFFLALSALALVRCVLSAVAVAAAAGADQLGELLHSGRVLVAERLRQAAGIIDPSPLATTEAQATYEPLPAVEATVDPPATPEPVSVPVPLVMLAAAQVTVEGPAVEARAPTEPGTDEERERLAAVLTAHGTIRGAARALGVGESTLRSRLKRHGVEAPTRTWRRDVRTATAA